MHSALISSSSWRVAKSLWETSFSNARKQELYVLEPERCEATVQIVATSKDDLARISASVVHESS